MKKVFLFTVILFAALQLFASLNMRFSMLPKFSLTFMNGTGHKFCLCGVNI